MPIRPINAFAAIAVIGALAWAPAAAVAQTKLKWAHVYETGEPYHTEAVWAGEEIKKRTNGKYEIQVFPASQLGNENQINEALGLGTVDMIYTGVAFAGSIHKPIAITNAPFVLRDFDHLHGLSRRARCSAPSPRATRTRPSTRSSR